MANEMDLYLNTVHQLYKTAYGIDFPAGIEEDVPPTPTSRHLCFTANYANSTIGMEHYGSNQTTTKPTIYISIDGINFTEWDYTTITLANIGDKVWMYGDNPDGIGSYTSNVMNYSKFTISGLISASGDTTTLIIDEGTEDLTGKLHCFYSLFEGCTSLSVPPELPATALASSCYRNMFYGCTSLTTAPVLPATTLADNCYASMFYGCTSLTTAPELPATILPDFCYSQMFKGCTLLNAVTCLATNISGYNCTVYWLRDTSEIGTFTKSAAMNDWPTGENGIPAGWTVINYEG